MNVHGEHVDIAPAPHAPSCATRYEKRCDCDLSFVHKLPAPTIIPAESVAAMLGLSVRSVYAAARAGQLPARRVGRRFIFCRETIAEWARCRE